MQTPVTIQDTIARHEAYLESDPANLLLRLDLGDLYHRAGRTKEAIGCYEECLLQDPGCVSARSRLASVMITQHRFAEAESALRDLLSKGETDAALTHNLGLSLYYQERWDEARKCFEDAAAQGLQIPTNFAYLARTLHHLGSMPEAIDNCRRWAELAPDTASKSYLALLYMDSNDTERARQLALEVVAQAPHDVNANVVLGVSSTEKQDMAAARAHFHAVLRQEDHNGRAWLGLGLVHLYEGEHEKAIEALERATHIYAHNAGAIVALGWAKLSAKDPVGAEQVFEQAIRVDRSFAESHGGLASALALQQKIDRAREEIKIARRLNPLGFGAEFAQVTILALQGQKQAATNLFNRALERSPREGMLPLVEQLRIYTTKKGLAAKPAQPDVPGPKLH